MILSIITIYSTSYQVYNNIEENPNTTAAIRETMGQVAMKNGKIMNTYYFSTSSGHTTDYMHNFLHRQPVLLKLPFHKKALRLPPGKSSPSLPPFPSLPRGSLSLDTKFYLMQKVFMHTSNYDTMIADYLKKERKDYALPETLKIDTLSAWKALSHAV